MSHRFGPPEPKAVAKVKTPSQYLGRAIYLAAAGNFRAALRLYAD
jgi:hypothetical protein